jgi:hypothetical protein
LSLPNPHPERVPGGHPHHRRLPRHARHLARQVLKLRTATRASVLQVHVRQLDSAVNLREHPGRLHPDSDRHSPGVRVMLGPELRSLLRQLLETRDVRVQQQLVREIVHQVQKRTLAALKRVRAVERARELGGKAARGARARGGGLWTWLLSLPARAQARAGRTARAGRKPVARSRAGGYGTVPSRSRAGSRTAREPRERTSRPRATRT